MRNIGIVKTNSYYYWYISIVIFFSLWIVYYRLPYISIFYIPAIIIIFLRSKYDIILRKDELVFIFIFIVYQSLPSSYQSIERNIGNVVNAVFIIALFFLRKEEIECIFIKVKYILVVILFFGFIFYTINLFGDIIKPFDVFVNEVNRLYVIYPFYVVEYPNFSYFDITEVWRFRSVFDEPGYLGTLAFFLLYIDSFDFSKKYNFLIFLCGLFTFSMAYYILCMIYYMLYSKEKIALILFSVMIILIFGYIYYNVNPEIMNRFISRFEISNTYEFAGDSRGGFMSTIDIYNSVISQDAISVLFGNGKLSYNHLQNGVDIRISDPTWVRIIYEYGLLYFILFITFLVRFSAVNINGLLFGILFAISLYQRPEVFYPIWFLLLIYSRIKYLKGISKKSWLFAELS